MYVASAYVEAHAPALASAHGMHAHTHKPLSASTLDAYLQAGILHEFFEREGSFKVESLVADREYTPTEIETNLERLSASETISESLASDVVLQDIPNPL